MAMTPSIRIMKLNTRSIAASAALLILGAGVAVHFLSPTSPSPQDSEKSSHLDLRANPARAWIAPVESSSASAVQAAPASMAAARAATLVVLQEADYGGHPAYNKAMFLMACQTYLQTKDSAATDLLALKQNGAPQELLDALASMNASKEVQCKTVNVAEFPAIDSLMQTAAEQGDKDAQGYQLRQDFTALNQSRSQALRNNTAGDDAVFLAQAQSYLNRAVELARAGNPEAALIASDITSSSEYGAQDALNSAKWRILGRQIKGVPFSYDSDTLDARPAYSGLSEGQRKVVVAQAEALFNACCAATP